jgi:hypothetical protein
VRTTGGLDPVKPHPLFRHVSFPASKSLTLRTKDQPSSSQLVSRPSYQRRLTAVLIAAVGQDMPGSAVSPLEAGPRPSRQLVSQFKVSEFTARREFLRRGRPSGQSMRLHGGCQIAPRKPCQRADNLRQPGPPTSILCRITPLHHAYGEPAQAILLPPLAMESLRWLPPMITKPSNPHGRDEGVATGDRHEAMRRAPWTGSCLRSERLRMEDLRVIVRLVGGCLALGVLFTASMLQ